LEKIGVELVNDIPALMGAKEMVRLEKGFPEEQKFVVVLADGTFQRLTPKWYEQ
jgi:hypothetical protein